MTRGKRLQMKLSRIQGDPRLTAKSAGLRYTSDTTPGFSRKKKDGAFIVMDPSGKKCRDKQVLERIRKLVLPPAWENVWICADENGHLQATGIDTKGRKQYRYHPAWNQIRSQTKYFRLPQFAEALPLIRERLERDLKSPTFSYHKILALAVSILEQTNIRVGNEVYKNLYRSFGLTTLQNKHVQINGTAVKFQFKGKKGVLQNLQLKSRRLARLIRQCREIPGKELFQYFDEQQNRHVIGSGDVNAYLKEISGMDFTAKDFRTWAGTLTAFRVFRDQGPADTAGAARQNIIKAVDTVAEALGNTRTVCKKYYIHPSLITAYESGALFDFLKEAQTDTPDMEWLGQDEKLLRDLLLQCGWD